MVGEPRHDGPIVRVPQETSKRACRLVEEAAAIDGDFADLDGVPRSITIASCRFLHLCSGLPRDGDLENQISLFFTENGATVIVDRVDAGEGVQYDLTQADVVARYPP